MKVVELNTERMGNGSQAVARLESGVVVFVEGAAPGEKLRVRITKEHKNYWDAEIVEILEPSKDRVQPPCPHFGFSAGKCGGCSWQHLSYDSQVRSKKEILLHQIHKMTKLELNALEAMAETHPAKHHSGYRSRIQVRGDSGGIGFYGRGTHDVVHIKKCMVAHPDLQAKWTEFATPQRLRELSSKTGQFKVEWSRTENGQIHEAINREHAALGFTQVNPEQNKVLQKLVSEYAGSGDFAMDLYGGSGNLSLPIQDRFKTILCVDTYNGGKDPTEIKHAAGMMLVKMDATEFLRGQYWKDYGLATPDTVIADPPRAGLEAAAPLIADLGAGSLVLVSCDPATLSRDLVHILKKYTIRKIHMVDMFPHTPHIETVIHLAKKA